MKEENRSHKDGEEPQGKRAHQDGEPKSKASSKTRTPVARTQPVSPDEGDHDEAGSGSSSRIDGLSAEFLGKIVASWQHAFSQSVRAIAYLKGRGLFVRDLLLALSIGYSSGKLPQILPRDDKLRRQLIEMGILNDRGNEFFYRRLVCPLFDQAGMLVNVYGRALDAHAQTPHLYLSGPRRGVFNRVGCLASREVIVTEAPLDAVSVAVMGFLNTTASFGAGGFTADHMALLLEGKIGRVYCAYDADPAGEHGADQLASDLAVHGIECLRVKWPVHIKDANDFLVAGGTRESLRSLLDEARPMTTLVPRPSRAAGSQPQDRVRQPEDSSLRAMPKDASPANEPTAAVFSERPSVSSDLLITAPQPPPAPPSPTSAPSPGLTPSASPSPGPAPHPPAGPLEPPQGEAPPVKPVAAETSVTVGPSASTAPSTATGENLITCGDRVYEVIALPRSGPGALRVRLKIDRDGKTFLDTLNLYSDAARSAAVHKISMLFGAKLRRELIEKDFHAMIAELHRRQAAAAPPPPVDPVEAMSLEDREEAIEFLRANDLIARIRADITGMGVVGEARAKLLMYLAILSRRLPTPLSLITISRSGAGKSFVMTCVLDLTPEGEVFVYTRVTAKALYNVDDALRLRHKVLVIEEAQGMQEAAYALRVMQSSRALRSLSTITDPTTGLHKAQENVVYGPVALIVTSTSELDSETSSRAFVISVDESEEQTRAIHQQQRNRRTFEGLDQELDRKKLIKRHKNVQRLLQPLAVVNEYARYLTFPSGTLQLRREHDKYLDLIDAITFLFQYQREQGVRRRGSEEVGYVLTAPEDIDLANELIVPSLRQAFEEVTTPERTLLGLMRNLVEGRCDGSDWESVRFTRRDIREFTKWGDNAVRKHLRRLEELEYVQAVAGCFGKEYVYRLTPGHLLAMPPKATLEEEIRDLGLMSSKDLRDRGLVR